MKTYNYKTPVKWPSLWLSDFEELLPSSLEDQKLFHSGVPYDVQETNEYYRLQLDIPGVDPKNICVKVQEQTLSVSADENKKEKDWRQSRTFKTSFSLPTYVDAENISANVENGVMDIVLPKKQTAQIKEIPVQSHSSKGFIEKVKKQFNKAH
ncbi:MAG: Hsp20/alpha crystallin family protein [Bdellovibrionales bacterium]|nr:Hsp20/alpha crystallin family protein [Bdellovibrionales bacterium]